MKVLRLLPPILLAATLLHGQKYGIHLAPAEHAGHKYLVSAKGTTFRLMSAGERILSKEDYRVEFEGRAEILEVDGKGQAVRIAFTAGKFTKITGDEAVELLKPGSVVISDGGLEEPISLKDGEIGEEARQAFGLVHQAHKPGSVTDDQIFGTTEPKSIGERWLVNPKLAAGQLTDTGVEIPPEHMHGSVELTAKDKVAGSECLSMRGDLQADGFAVKSLPPGFALDRGTVQATFRGCFPVSGLASSYRTGVDMAVDMHLTSKDGSIDMTFKQGTDATWTDSGK